MPQAIDQEALDSPNLKMLDIHHPPMKNIPREEYPRMVYLHPVDKTKQHRYKAVADKGELDVALKQGYKLEPHVPTEPEAPELTSGEFETGEVEAPRRGRRVSEAA